MELSPIENDKEVHIADILRDIHAQADGTPARPHRSIAISEIVPCPAHGETRCGTWFCPRTKLRSI
jgi:hypothetical protein